MLHLVLKENLSHEQFVDSFQVFIFQFTFPLLMLKKCQYKCFIMYLNHFGVLFCLLTHFSKLEYCVLCAAYLRPAALQILQNIHENIEGKTWRLINIGDCKWVKQVTKKFERFWELSRQRGCGLWRSVINRFLGRVMWSRRTGRTLLGPICWKPGSEKFSRP